MGISFVKLMAERDSRPCDSCGKRARCAPNRRFGGMLCGPCSAGIARAVQTLERSQCEAKPSSVPAAKRRRGVTQFASQPSPRVTVAESVMVSAWETFRRKPTIAKADGLKQAIDAYVGAMLRKATR